MLATVVYTAVVVYSIVRLSPAIGCGLYFLRLGHRAGQQLQACGHLRWPSPTPVLSALPLLLTPSSFLMKFGVHNVRLLTSKLDDLLEIHWDLAVDVLCLVETRRDDGFFRCSPLCAVAFKVVDKLLAQDCCSIDSCGI
jgi:hypothetical protein